MTLWQTFVAENKDLIGAIDPRVFVHCCHISLKHRYLYYETPKVACSSIKLTLQRAELDDPVLVRDDYEEIHHRDFSPLLKPTQTGSFRRLATSPEYFKFCFVRNPFTRVLSCYLDKIVGDFPRNGPLLRRLGYEIADLAAPIAFDAFLDAVAAQPVREMDAHWCVQWFHTAQDGLRYDAIGRYETFLEDFTRIAERLSIDLARYYHAETRNATGAGRRLGEFYDSCTVELVRTIYRADFSGFGYPPELPT